MSKTDKKQVAELENNAVVTDMELERGEHPIGRVCHISTATHAWRGRLAAVTPSYYILDSSQEVALVDSTGAIASYIKSKTGGSATDVIPPNSGVESFIPRGSVCWIISWKK